MTCDGSSSSGFPHPGPVHGFVGLADVSAAAARAGDDPFRQYGAVAHRE
jgi:hypothetical protein